VPSERFPGFPSGSRATVVPNTFFTAVLPAIEDPAELAVTLYSFFALGRRVGTPRAIPIASLAAEAPLMRALAPLPGGAQEALRRGLTLAIERGTLMIVGRQGDGSSVLALNTAVARRVAAERGLLAAETVAMDDDPTQLQAQPGIFALYEENIGSVPPLLMDELDEAERLYPRPWIEAAFREAVANNRRSWRYISRILERWRLEGPNYETAGRRPSSGTSGRRRTVGGPYRRIVEGGRGGDGRT
jgi:DNA replication protein